MVNLKKKKQQKKERESRRQSYLATLNEEERELYDAFVAEIKGHLDISKAQNEAILADFHDALYYYQNHNVPVSEAFRRLDPRQLGGFYMHEATAWYPLDNAAVIYPLSMKHNRMPMFRLSCYLKEEVSAEILQMALLFTIKRFPAFATAVREGFFWHYLDSAKMRYTVQKEEGIPLEPIPVAFRYSQSFRVLYYQKRISVEFFHVLTDGSGGLVFLNTLVREYLTLLGKNIPLGEGLLDVNGLVDTAELENEFANSALKEESGGFTGKTAVQMSGRIASVAPSQILHFDMDTAVLRKTAKQYGVSVTAYLLGMMFLAEKFATEEADGEVHIQVPVNMRKFNHSRTLRNYAMYLSCNLTLKEITSLKDILPSISDQLKEKSSYEEMSVMMSTTIRLIRSVRFVPLAIKKPVMKLIYGYLGDAIFSNYLSNLGVVEVNEEMRECIDYYDFVLGPSAVSRAACALISFKEHARLSIIKSTADPSFEEKLAQLLSCDGIDVMVEGSGFYAG